MKDIFGFMHACYLSYATASCIFEENLNFESIEMMKVEASMSSKVESSQKLSFCFAYHGYYC